MSAPRTITSSLRRTGLEAVGWTLVVVGVAALFLPGPGLLTLAAGLAVLSRQYHWAHRFLQPVKAAAFRAAAEGVRSWPRLLLSVLGALALVAAGVAWGVRPAAPGWWPLAGSWWLPGGWAAGASLIVSGLIALTLLGYSYWRFRHTAHPQVTTAGQAPPTG